MDKWHAYVSPVCVREMATAAKERLAAMWPMACMDAGPKMVLNSDLVMGRPKDAFLAPSTYVMAQ